MARIRTVKPEFFTSEDICALSPLARLLYIGIWCESDKEGRLPWKPMTFKLRYFPADNCDIKAMCTELVESGLVVLYGEGLAYVPSFSKHQHVNPRESKSVLPEPPNWQASSPTGRARGDIREAILERDDYKCVRCGSSDRLEIDHILPQSAGGPTVEENLRTLCKSCNSGRPVSGDLLQSDLALDGLSIESLQSKYLRVPTRADASISDLHAQGGREGKGKEGEKNPPLPPEGESADGEGEKPKPKRASKIGLDAFLQACRESGQSAVPSEDPVFAYADRIGLPRPFVALAWRWFKGRYADKRQAGVTGWRKTFRNAVEGNWPKFWFVDDAGQWHLTTTGKQAQMAADAEQLEAAA